MINIKRVLVTCVAAFGLSLAWAGAEEWIQPAIDAAAAKGGGRVVVPAGDHPCRSLRLRSNVELHLEKGARLIGSVKSEDYFSFPDEVCAIHPENSKKVFLYGWDLENVAITGEGVIDGQGPEFFDRNTVLWKYFWAKPKCERPRMVQLVNCRGIRFEGVTFKDSPCWTMLIKKCENIVFERIRVLADLHIVNSDGVDFDTCRHVRVRNCEFSTGDDCFAIRAIKDPGSDARAICEDIEITDCKLESNCQTVRFGCPSDDEIRNITVRNVTGKGGYCLNFDYPAHYLSPNDDGYMDIHDILIENYKGEARHVGIRIAAEPGVKIRSVRNVTFRNVDITCPKPAVYVSNVFSKMENIRYENVTLNGVKAPDGPVTIDASNAAPLKRADGASWETNAKSKGKKQAEKPLLILHLDFNSIQMRKDAVLEHLRTAAGLGYNAILWEIEDKIRWETCPECVHPEAFTKDDFRAILAEADRLGLEPIPLMQTFAHAEYILAHEKYRAWREVDENPTCYCVSKPEVREFQKRFLREYLDLFGGRVRNFHLGADEAHAFGSCPVCSKRDRFELFMEHLNEVASVLRERGIKPGIWCDMMLTGKLSDAELDAQVKKFPKDLTAWYWDYYYGNQGKNHSYWANRIQHLTKNGFSVIFAPATASCDDGPFLPLYGKHSKNVSAAADLARAEKLRGLCVTSWSVHLSPKRLQYPLWDLAARRFLNPGTTMESDFQEILSRRLGPVNAQTMTDLTGWFNRLARFDSRFGIFAAKWARPAFVGTARDTVARMKSEIADYVPPTSAEIEAVIKPIKAALAKLEALPPDNRLDPFLAGARLSIKHLQAIADELDGKVPSEIPEEETVAFYGLEQRDWSAEIAAKLIWSPLVGRSALAEKIAAKHKILKQDIFQGGKRTTFDFHGYKAWVVEPPDGVKIAAGQPWTWTMQWAEAFVNRTPVRKLLARGWHHVTIDTFKHRMDAEGLAISRKFQDYLVSELGLARKTCLIGMSWGGFFSTRYSFYNPGCVQAIYYDAPLMNFAAFGSKKGDGSWVAKTPAEGWATSSEMPVNMAKAMAESQIPILLLYGRSDTVVPPKENCELFISRYQEAGGKNLTVRPRGMWGHHPHGVDDTDSSIANFFLNAAR